MPQFDPQWFVSQVFWLIVTFAVLYVIMSKLVLPRISGVLEEREERIADDLDKAQHLMREAESVLAGYERSMAEAREQARAALRVAHEQAVRDTAEGQAALAAELSDQAKSAEARIAAARAEAVGQVQDIAVEVARAATSHLVGVEPETGRVAAAVAEARGERA